MNVVDSSGWLEYFADGPNAEFFAPAIEDTGALLVPSISLYDMSMPTAACAAAGILTSFARLSSAAGKQDWRDLLVWAGSVEGS